MESQFVAPLAEKQIGAKYLKVWKSGGNLTSEGRSRLNYVEFPIQLISFLTYPMLKIDE